ncbi:serpin B6-like [Rhincodon typus]|uniref:serpin B6-like n=1 Tax=Rhincodon typus TaxID=259920 RepID=UPI0009A423BC|nr:serpin B6-like [Rhincodon typus]XP_020386541.1 serpin B6-like [Rhincodon typus]XP_048470856.1 serpin B6-like [Rhincodon typus]
MDILTDANNCFALDLYLKLCEETRTENIFFSPLSISTALAMVFLGAKGNTNKQMAKVLHFGGVGNVCAGFQKLQSDMKNLNTANLLKVANGLYRDNSFDLHCEYLESMSKFYQAELAAIDFAERSEEARVHINAWVEGQTEGKIQNLLAQGTVDADSKLVLVNAVYFKGNWEKKFDEDNTEERPFIVTKNESKPVKMMCQKGTFNTAYIEEVATNVLELPYTQDELSMIILLPDEIGGLEKLQKSLTYDKLLKWTSVKNLDPSEIFVNLPKFKLEGSYDLRATLAIMGMSEAFDRRSANFSGMTGTRDLCLSNVIHKSFVDVNEEGSEAAASTEATLSFRCFSSTGEFIADHPFLFYIRHNKTQSILFLGQFSSP